MESGWQNSRKKNSPFFSGSRKEQSFEISLTPLSLLQIFNVFLLFEGFISSLYPQLVDFLLTIYYYESNICKKNNFRITYVPYILAYKLRNFGKNLANISSIWLIHGSEIWFWETRFSPLCVCFKVFQTS